MSEFVKVNASKLSLACRRPVYGVGINDAEYMVRQTVNNKTTLCKTYSAWRNMLQRCYSKLRQEKNPTYKGCSVCDEWLIFSNFAKWFDSHYIEGFELDKDIKVVGNKVYSPDTCLFISSEINALLISCDSSRGKYLVGVSFSKQNKAIQAQISIDCKRVHLGFYDSERLANKAYAIAKNKEIMRKCEQYPYIAKYLINHLIS